jgi:hypothetical protein
LKIRPSGIRKLVINRFFEAVARCNIEIDPQRIDELSIIGRSR